MLLKAKALAESNNLILENQDAHVKYFLKKSVYPSNSFDKEFFRKKLAKEVLYV